MGAVAALQRSAHTAMTSEVDATPHRHVVLIVEDHDDTREAFAILAEFNGFDVATAAHGRDALAQLRAGLRPCLIILDLLLDDMDGLAFRREQLVDSTIAHIPVAIISGTGLSHEADARALGLTVFLRKPVEMDQLLKHMHEHCG
jgi:CheY-like chemotaxis protein